MSKPVLGLDFDDVIFAHNDALFAFQNERDGTSFTRDDIMHYGLEKTWGCSREEAHTRVMRFFHSPDHFKTQPLPGSIEAVELLERSYDIHLITARSAEFLSQTQEWLQHYLPILADRLYFTREVHGGESRPKSDVCKELGVSVFVDDALHHAEDLAPAVERVFLLDTPWNQTEEALPANVKRVYSWEEITRELV
ncbi:MAG: hypothetical protein WDZ79_00785 [Candidatus Paceibacterota bacterium]